MINFTKLANSEFNNNLLETFSGGEDDVEVCNIIRKLAAISFTKFTKSNSIFFTLGHSLSTSLIGLGVLDAMKLQYGEVRQSECINLMASILFCNVGIVHGILKDDKEYKIKISSSDYEDIQDTYTSSCSWRHKSFRSKEFINESPYISSNVNVEIISRAIDFSDITKVIERHAELGKNTRLVRAIQIISLMADENFSRRQVEFFYSATEGGALNNGGSFDHNIFSSLEQFRENFGQVFWEILYPDVGDVLLLLRETIGGKKIVSKIYAHL